MPRGSNLLDSIQSGGQTINTFNQVDADTITGVSAGSLHMFHKNKRHNENRFSYKNRNGYTNTNNGKRFIPRLNYRGSSFSSPDRSRGRNFAGRFPSRARQMGSYRNPGLQRGSYNSYPSKERGQQYQQPGRESPIAAAR